MKKDKIKEKYTRQVIFAILKSIMKDLYILLAFFSEFSELL